MPPRRFFRFGREGGHDTLRLLLRLLLHSQSRKVFLCETVAGKTVIEGLASKWQALDAASSGVLYTSIQLRPGHKPSG
jgi:hypothetical protein